MKHFGSLVLISIILFYATQAKAQQLEMAKSENTSWTQLLDSLNLQGSILIWDYEQNILYSNNFDRTNEGFLPASTFKIPNSIVALESGVLHSDTGQIIWQGDDRYLDVWEQNLSFRQAYQYSCVPCYQDVALKVGVKQMRYYLEKIQYPGMVFDEEQLDRFWLEGESKISQMQQIEFLKKLYFNEIGLKDSTISIMKRMMLVEDSQANQWYAKTGWAVRQGNNLGWYVGYLITPENRILFFATNVEPMQDFDMERFAGIRNYATQLAFQDLKIIP